MGFWYSPMCVFQTYFKELIFCIICGWFVSLRYSAVRCSIDSVPTDVFNFIFLQAYNITNDEPIFFWTFLTQMLVGLGYAAPKFHLPYCLIYFIAVILAWLVALLRPVVTLRPTFTPMTVALAGTHHFYSCQRAKDDMQYQPIVSLPTAITETLESFSHLRNES